MRRWITVALTFVTLFAGPSRAQDGGVEIPPPGKLVIANVAAVVLGAGTTTTATVTLDIAKGWHINANPAAPDYMVATVVELTGGSGVKLGTPRYPPGRGIKFGFEAGEVSVLDGRVAIELPLVASAQAIDGAHTINCASPRRVCRSHSR